jgi:hypothetical protein
MKRIHISLVKYDKKGFLEGYDFGLVSKGKAQTYPPAGLGIGKRS